MGSSLSMPKLKASIDGAISRLKIKSAQAKNQAKKERTEIASLLREKKEELAQIRAEALYQTDNRTEAMAIVEQQLEVLRLRVNLLVSEKDCPKDLVSTIATILYSVDRSADNVVEMQEIRKQLQLKYAAQYLKSIEGSVHPRLVETLSCTPPGLAVVNKYLEQIALSSGVEYTPSPSASSGVPPVPSSSLSSYVLPAPSIIATPPMPPAAPSHSSTPAPPFYTPPAAGHHPSISSSSSFTAEPQVAVPVVPMAVVVSAQQPARVIAITHPMPSTDGDNDNDNGQKEHQQQPSPTETAEPTGAGAVASPNAEPIHENKVDPSDIAARIAALRK